MATVDETAPAVMTTVDGTPLKVRLQRAIRRARIRSFLLVLPLFFFLTVAFLLPIIDMLYRGVDNEIVSEVLPLTTVAIQDWDEESGELPGEAVFEAMVKDIQVSFKDKTLGRAGRRLNYDKPGMSSIFRGSGRKAKKITEPPFKEQLIAANKGWGDITTWTLIKRESRAVTDSYFLAAVDMHYDAQGKITGQPENRQIYIQLFGRTLLISGIITALCILLGYPVAYLLATLPVSRSNLLMILVLLPFWTSLLVRTTSWIALLQTEGVLNDLMVGVGLLSDDGRLQMIHNKTGTIIAMTHILLPFMVLPLYSVMKTIPPTYMRAARSLGATPLIAFIRVYMPNTVAGVGAGSILVFILAIGYYITPALVGGQTGTFISNQIADHVSTTLNWGLAAALGGILLAIVLGLYLLYDKIVGIDNMKLG
jgi:putative spermidine/putrescine transport system permease protein